jgi:hypothetical protein
MRTIARSVIAAAILYSAAQPAYAQSYFARGKLPVVLAQTPPAWVEGGWSAWNSTCSETATRTKTVECKANGETVPDEQCTAAKPQSSETTGLYTGCTNFVKNGDFTQGAQTWTGLSTDLNPNANPPYAKLGLSGVLAAGGTATTQTYPLDPDPFKVYTLKASCAPVGSAMGNCSLKLSITSNGQNMMTSYYTTNAVATTVRSFGQFGSYGGPVTLTIQNTGTKAMYIDTVSIN